MTWFLVAIPPSELCNPGNFLSDQCTLHSLKASLGDKDVLLLGSGPGFWKIAYNLSDAGSLENRTPTRHHKNWRAQRNRRVA